MNSHLVTVKVGVERSTDKRMQLNRFALDQDRLKSLYTESVQSRSTVEHNGMLFNDLFKHIPNFRTLFFNHFLGAFDGGYQAALFKLVVDKRFEQFQCHFFRKTALMQFKLRADNDNGTAGVINTFTEKVLPETS